MGQKKALSPHEIRVLKIDRNAIVELIQEILRDISYKKFRLPYKYENKKICVDCIFDEEKCEIIIVAYRSSNTCKNDIVTYVKELQLEATESLLMNPNGGEYYCSVKETSFLNIHPNSINKKNEQKNMLDRMFDLLKIQARPLRNHEIRVIRLSTPAIKELLWEHFMKTGDDVMDIPKEEIDDISTIYSMNIIGKFDALILYVMNIDEASDISFAQNKKYCEENVRFTTDSYLKNTSGEQKYVSLILS